MTTEKLTWTIEEACNRLGVSRSLGYSLAKKGLFPGLLKLGNRFVVSKYQLEKYLNGDGVKGEAINE